MAVRTFSEKIHTFNLWICLQRLENEFTSAEKAVMLFLGFVNLCCGFDYCLKGLMTFFFFVLRHSWVWQVVTPRVGLENDRDKVFLVSFCFKAERLMEAIELYKEETLKMNEECKVFVIDGFKLSCLEVQYCIWIFSFLGFVEKSGLLTRLFVFIISTVSHVQVIQFWSLMGMWQ